MTGPAVGGDGAGLGDGARPLHPSTLAVTAGRPEPFPGEALNQPVVLTSGFHAEGPVAYARDGNPTWEAFEAALGALEGGTAVAFSSGLAAASAVIETLRAGAVVVVAADAYNGVRRLLADLASRDRIWVRHVDITAHGATLAACDGAALLWLESPTNPRLAVADLAALAAGARAKGVIVVVDNTFATPLLQRPLDLGADVVVHSVTKLLAGHSDLVMGAAVARSDDTDMVAALRRRRSLHGAIPGPFETFLALRGLRTLPVRLGRAQATAGELARRLQRHPTVARVRYPGLPTDPGHDLAARQMKGAGSVLSFEVHGGGAAADAVCESVRLIVHATSLGGVETLMERRNRWEGEDSVPPSLLRLSVGLEHVDDLWADLEQALRAAIRAAGTRA